MCCSHETSFYRSCFSLVFLIFQVALKWDVLSVGFGFKVFLISYLFWIQSYFSLFLQSILLQNGLQILSLKFILLNQYLLSMLVLCTENLFRVPPDHYTKKTCLSIRCHQMLNCNMKLCNDDWNTDHRKWLKRYLLTRGDHIYKKIQSLIICLIWD